MEAKGAHPQSATVADMMAGPRKSNVRQRSAATAGAKQQQQQQPAQQTWPVGLVINTNAATSAEAESQLRPPADDGLPALVAALPTLAVSAASPEQARRTPRAPPESPPAPELPWASAVCAPGDDADCVVCMDADRSWRLQPCLHAAFCAPCAAALLATLAPACPLCRIPVTGCEAAL